MLTAKGINDGGIPAAKLNTAVQTLLANALRRTGSQNCTVCTYSFTATPSSSGTVTKSVADEFKSVGFVIAQINEQSSSLVANACNVSGTNVLISVRKVADGTPYASVCSLKLVVFGEHR